MNPIFIFEAGIRPWEESEPPSNCRFATVSIVVSSLMQLLPLLNKVLPGLGGAFTSWFRSYTLRESFEGNAIQRRKLIATLSEGVGNFRQPVVRTNDGVLSSVAGLVMPISVFELETLSDYQRELLVGTKDSSVTTETLSSFMALHSQGRDPVSLSKLLVSRSDLAFGRLFSDSDTHSTFQWFGCETDLRLLEQALVRLNVRSLASRNEVTDLLGKPASRMTSGLDS